MLSPNLSGMPQNHHVRRPPPPPPSSPHASPHASLLQTGDIFTKSLCVPAVSWHLLRELALPNRQPRSIRLCSSKRLLHYTNIDSWLVAGLQWQLRDFYWGQRACSSS